MTEGGLRVLFFTQYYPPEVGATQTRMQTFAEHLVDRGHDVTVVTELPNHPKGEIFEGWRGRWIDRRHENGVEVIRLRVYTSPRKSPVRRLLFYGTYAAGASAVGAGLALRGWDAVFATSPPLPAAVPGWLTARLARAPFVLDVRDLWPAVAAALGELDPGVMLRTAEKLERFLYRRAEAVTVVTESFRKHVADGGADPERIRHLPNGTVPELFAPDRRDPELRERLGVGEDGVLVGYFGNHGVAQGLETVLGAADRLRGRSGLCFHFVGEGPRKEELMTERDRQGLENVHFHDQVPLEEIAAWINAADLMLVPLADHPLFRQFVPSKLYDYLACATPVVLSVEGEAREILDASGGGLAVPPGDSEALARAVARLADEPERREAMGRAGREHVLAHYTRDRQAERLEDLLTELAGAAA